ncbi:MAG: hypothetical protein LBD42_07500 [Desulfovibrio sp.]|nr:hypothetical protein [Desulfovibrio sp.]
MFVSSRDSLLPGRVLAAPSWVMPGTIVENCVFLATMVDEVGLLFMESASCLAYDKQELPDFLADLSLSYHVHLPVDLPMHEPARAAGICAALLDAAAHLPTGNFRREEVWRENLTGAPYRKTGGSADECVGGGARSSQGGGMMRAVIHPPRHDSADASSAARSMAAFAEAWLLLGKHPSQLLLENVRGNDLTCLAGLVREYDFGLCLDMGHVLAYGQDTLLCRHDLLRRVDMLHVNAPASGCRAGAHLPLDSLDAAGRRQAERICKSIPRHTVIMMELFSWQYIEESLPLIRAWL